MIDGIVEFYQRNQHGDMLFFKQGGFWGSPWTVAPHDPENAPRIAEQYVAMKADGLRHAERVTLQSPSGVQENVVVITDLPIGRQTVVGIASGEERKLRKPVGTETLTAITAAIKGLGPKAVYEECTISRS